MSSDKFESGEQRNGERSGIMSMSDCVKCWETPCVCGANYKHLSINELGVLISELQKLVKVKKKKNDIPDRRYFDCLPTP